MMYEIIIHDIHSPLIVIWDTFMVGVLLFKQKTSKLFLKLSTLHETNLSLKN
jgi:hypothetical protein